MCRLQSHHHILAAFSADVYPSSHLRDGQITVPDHPGMAEGCVVSYHKGSERLLVGVLSDTLGDKMDNA